MTEIEYPQRIRGGAGYFPEAGKVIIEGYYGAEIELSAESSNGEVTPDIWQSFVPSLVVGGSPGGMVDFGVGYSYGQYKVKKVTVDVAGDRKSVV